MRLAMTPIVTDFVRANKPTIYFAMQKSTSKRVTFDAYVIMEESPWYIATDVCVGGVGMAWGLMAFIEVTTALDEVHGIKYSKQNYKIL